jgi:preprotein translocase subunit SecG
MRYIGLILALGVIGWVLYQAAGGGKAETAIPESYQQSLGKAKGVEQAMQDAAKKSMQEAEEKSGQ